MPVLLNPDSLSVVTGASSGIGEATARLLASRGSHVCLLARNADRLAAISEDVRKCGGKADAFAVDLADPQALADVYGSGLSVTLAMFGTVETSYWEHNPGSRERLPRQAAGIRTLNAEQVASAIVTGIE
jgi:short-subunit dehydrogenase